MQVFDKSPAQKAGLIPHEDYLLGTHDIILKTMDDLHYLIRKYDNQTALVQVYNTFNKNVREVKLFLKEDWGGEGRLGCDVGHGYLHRLPLLTTPASSSNGVSAGNSRDAYDVPFETSTEPIIVDVRECFSLDYLSSCQIKFLSLPLTVFPSVV